MTKKSDLIPASIACRLAAQWLAIWLLCLPVTSFCQGNANGLVGYYTFCDCTARDNSGNNLDGTIIGTPQCIRGIRDYGLLLNQTPGTNSCGQRGGQYIRLPTLGDIWSGGFTVCAWIRFDNQNYFERIIDFGNSSGESGGLPIWFGREGNSNNLALESWVNSSGSQARGTGRLTATNVITNGNIEYYCATINKDTMRIFVNGALRAQRIGNPIANVTRTNNFIGHSNWCPYDPDFKGFMDEVRIYNRALSEQEIQNLFLITNVNDFAVTKTCNSPKVDFSVPNVTNIDSLTWDFGDPASGIQNTGNGQSVSHSFSAPGTYPVRVIAYKACLYDTVIKQVRVHQVPDQFLGNDLDLCPGRPQLLQVSIPGASYRWQDGSVASQLAVDQPGTYWVQATIDGCTYRDSVMANSLQKTTLETVTICDGQSYLGYAVSGRYIDTFPAANGCDSIRTLDLSVRTKYLSTETKTICSGQSYLGYAAAGIYSDTIRYFSGCDSLVRQLNLVVQEPVFTTNTVSICDGDQYVLPSGNTVSIAGSYRDTLLYSTGCDSLIREINLLVNTVTTQTTSAGICAGASYLLPWNQQVTAAGIYRDTLRYASGCDSLIRIVSLAVTTPLSQATNASICAGKSYQLPWGLSVSTAGVYRDTIKTSVGCDSILRQVNLTVQAPTVVSSSTSICSGEQFILPWGRAVSTTGVYRDTLFYPSGCDSLVREVSVTVKAVQRKSLAASICTGGTYMLPWNQQVSTAGIYRDTLRYMAGCDSVITDVALSVTAPAMQTTDAVICVGETYLLPWGVTVANAGTYRDTVRTSTGCDSLLRVIRLRVSPIPIVTVEKSNDINCVLGSSKLFASGGTTYTWRPATSLNDPSSPQPVASPAKPTTYYVQVTSAEGCTAEDSVMVEVSMGNPDSGYLVPNAFTPNGDGTNDRFGVAYWGAVEDFTMAIYNRWGEQLFFTRNNLDCWDGRIKTGIAAMGVYVYFIQAKTRCGPVQRKGYVTLIR